MIEADNTITPTTAPVKRGRGRPKGSKNKPKIAGAVTSDPVTTIKKASGQTITNTKAQVSTVVAPKVRVVIDDSIEPVTEDAVNGD